MGSNPGYLLKSFVLYQVICGIYLRCLEQENAIENEPQTGIEDLVGLRGKQLSPKQFGLDHNHEHFEQLGGAIHILRKHIFFINRNIFTNFLSFLFSFCTKNFKVPHEKFVKM